jgi:hypothetical protein
MEIKENSIKQQSQNRVSSHAKLFPDIKENSIIQQLQNRASSHDTLDQQVQIVPLAILPVPIDTAPLPSAHLAPELALIQLANLKLIGRRFLYVIILKTLRKVAHFGGLEEQRKTEKVPTASKDTKF